MNRIDKMWARLKTSGKKMLSPYLTAGDPSPTMTVALMHALVRGGADLLELGVPFSDPMAEGPVIQAAMERALTHGVALCDVLELVQTFRMDDPVTPVVLMGYMNPIEQYGHERFAVDARLQGVDGLIIVDLPPEESQDLLPCWQRQGLYPIYLCSPTTSKARMKQIDACGVGYLYYVSLKGVTGAASPDFELVASEYRRCKAHTSLPMVVGFGIKTPKMAAQVADFSDGVVVGAALVTAIHEAAVDQRLQIATQFLSAMRLAMDKE